MLSNTIGYILFLAAFFAAYWALPWQKARNVFLLSASYYFYALFDWRFVGLIAGSFHCAIMGDTFKKPFLSLRGQVDEHESRPASLLRKIGCSNRLVNPMTSIDEMERLLCEPMPNRSAALENMRAASLDWLKKAVG